MVDSDDDSNAPAAPYITLEQQMAMEEKLEEEIAKNNGSAYVEGIHSIIGTSCDPEQCWSMVDAIFTKRHSRMSPKLFDIITGLKWNHDMWTFSDVTEANHRQRNESKSKSGNQEAIKERFINQRDEIRAWNRECTNEDGVVTDSDDEEEED